MIALLLAAALALPAVPFHEMDRAAVDSVLARPDWRRAPLEERLRRLARLRLGTPYALGCLGEERGPDGDPIFRVDRADCTVLVVTDAALAHADRLGDVERWMRRIHYRDGIVTYENRYHFTTDRVLNSPWFEAITGRAAPDSLLRGVTVTLNRKATGERLLDVEWEREVTVRYLPSGLVTEEALGRLPGVCGVAFVNEKNVASGFLVSHEGIVVDGRTLHHASSAAGKVVNVDLLEYLFPDGHRPRFDGVIFYRFK